MPKKTADTENVEKPLEALALDYKKDRYKLAFAAIRWAKEIKQKENLPDSIPILSLRALREILTGKVTIKEVEKLPLHIKVAPPPAPAPTPTLTLNVSAEDKE